MPSTNIAVIGSGIIGRTLATRFAQAGHDATNNVGAPR
jgi:2-polyprenyl-6-methoxyphenol hydroxylase-like FAD-dependent oxidoreductase